MPTSSKPLFSKRHYKFIAERLLKENRVPSGVIHASVLMLSDIFKLDNPKFDLGKFLKSCGL